MTKVFPKSRICVIDIYPSFEKGLKVAIDFASKHNIQLSSADGRRVLLGFCLKSIESSYKSVQSIFPKVLCMSKKNINKRLNAFIDIHLTHMMEYVPMPYCGKFDLSSPDLETAAESSLKKQKTQKKYSNLISKLRLKN